MAWLAGAELTGQLLVNGELRNEKAFKRVSAYVTQVRTDGRLDGRALASQTATHSVPSSKKDESALDARGTQLPEGGGG